MEFRRRLASRNQHRMFQRFLVCGLVLASWFVTFPVARSQTLDDTGLWFAAFGNGQFEYLNDDSPLRWWFDAHYRLRNDSDGFDQSILRPGLGLQVAEDQVLWAGYAWIGNSPVTDEYFNEHRFWQQWSATPSVGDWKSLHRSRLEQRWRETGDDVGWRWRQMHRVQKILTSCPQWSLIGWDEAFFHLNDTDWGAATGLDQNRAFLGFGYNRCPHTRVRTEIGYINHFTNRQGGEDGMNHLLSISFFY